MTCIGREDGCNCATCHARDQADRLRAENETMRAALFNLIDADDAIGHPAVGLHGPLWDAYDAALARAKETVKRLREAGRKGGAK